MKSLKRYFNTNLTVQQFLKYSITGCTSFVVEYAAFYLIYHFIGLWYIWSNSIAMTLGFVTSFFMNRTWSFKSKANIYRQFVMYGTLFIINLFISNSLMYLFSDIIGIIPPISKIFSVMILTCWNFIIYKKVIFK